jgi:iron(III) transport system permease protein
MDRVSTAGTTRGGPVLYLLLLLFLGAVFGPLCALVLITAQYLPGNLPDVLGLLVPAGRRLGLLLSSITLAAAVAGTGTLIGLLAGSLLWDLRDGVWSRARWLVVVLAPVPAFLYAEAWMAVCGWLETAGSVAAWVPGGWVLSFWVQLGAVLPIAVGLCMLAMAAVDIPSIEAARLVAPEITVFWRIVVPIAAPALGACAGLLFLLSLTDYSVPTLFSVNVYALEIFAEFSASSEPARALLLAIPLLLLTLIVMFATQRRIRNLMEGTGVFQRRASPPEYPRWFAALRYGALGVVVLHAGALLASLLFTAVTMGRHLPAVADASGDIGVSFGIGIAAAVCCLPLAYAAATMMNRSGRQGGVWWLLCIAPLAIPSPLVGIGLIVLWNSLLPAGIYGTAAMPVLAALARFAPVAALILLAQLRHTDPLLTDAARVFQHGAVRTWVQVRLPLLAPGLVAAACMVFALSVGELGATLLVIPPGLETVTIRMYNYLHYGSSGAVAGLGLVMTALMIAAGGMAVAAMRGWSRLMTGNPSHHEAGGDAG